MGIDTATEPSEFSTLVVSSIDSEGIVEFHECKSCLSTIEFTKLVKELAEKYKVKDINWFNKFLGHRNDVISFKEVNDYIKENYPKGIVNKLIENRK